MQRGKSDTVKAGLVGAAIGVTATLLSKKENRQKLATAVKKVKKKAEEGKEVLTAKAQKSVDKASRTLEE